MLGWGRRSTLCHPSVPRRAAQPCARHTLVRRAPYRLAWLGLLGWAAAAVAAGPAAAQMGSARYSALVMDAATGTVMSAVSADAPRYPASLTKLMTLYMTFEALRDRRITLETLVPVSAHAASMEPTKLGLVPGSRLSVEQAVLGMVTLSANDAAAALGELLGGDEQRFGQLMTMRARALGMSHSVFRNASGLPDPQQVTSASDMALLARHLIQDFPDQYHYFSAPSFTFHGRVVFNHDRMLQTYPGADGLKTGYIEAAGHNLVTSAVHGSVRLIGVVLGAGSNAERDLDMRSRLDEAFLRLDAPAEPTSRFAGLIARAEAAPMPTRAAGLRLADARPGRKPPAPAHFLVQLGSFADQAAARRVAAAAARGIDGGDVRILRAGRGVTTSWRVEIVGMTEAEAAGACSFASRRHAPCSILRGEPGQVASR
jgi:D-alanyl-D-alanine carboxypeptidase